MPRIARGLVFALVVSSCSMCGPPAEWPRVHVVSFAPDATTLEDLPSIEITFDGPVATEAQVATPIDASWIDITPSVELAAHFRDRQTLVLRPARALSPGTRYTVALGAHFPVVVPEDQRSHSFVHAPLEAVGITGADADWFPPNAEFGLHFGLPVASSAVAAGCELTNGDTHVALTASAPNAVQTIALVRPSSPLTPDASYDLSCPELVAAGGNEPMATATIAHVHVYPPAGLAETEPDAGALVTPDELAIVLRFATPTPLDEVRRHVRLSPVVNGLAARWVSRDPTTAQVTLDLDASSEYTIHVDAEIADQFGQHLDAPIERRFRTTDASPRVSMETGIFAVEAALPGYRVWSRNVRHLDVTCAFVPTARIPEILTSSMDYDPWYSDGQHDMNWSEHGLTPTTFPIEHADAHNHWTADDVDFTQHCAGRSTGRRGVYLAEVRAPDVEADRSGQSWWQYPYRVLANVTNMGVLLQAGPSSGLVWVAQISDGAPIANANVTVFDPQGNRIHRTRTDANGVAMLPGSRQLLHVSTPSVQADAPASDEDDGDYASDDWSDVDTYRSQRMIVIVENGTDVAALDGNWANGIQLYNFGMPTDTSTGGQAAIRGFILSDRGIYRPGESTHFKGWVRELAVGGTPRVPTQRGVSVSIEDAHGSILYERRARLTPFGGFSFDYAIDADAPTGDYYVRATIADHTFRERFAVQEFRPVAFEVARTDSAAAPSPGSEVSMSFRASYLFGAPLAHARATYSVNRRRRFLSYSEYPNYTFDDWSQLDSEYFWSRYSTPSTDWVTDGQLETDDHGDVALRYQDHASTRGPQDYLVDVNVTDPTGQTVSERAVVTVHPTDLYLGLFTEEYVQAVRMPFAVHAVAITPDGHRAATSAQLSLVRRTSNCADGAGLYGYWNCPRQETVVWTRDLALNEGGVSIERIDPTEAGEFVIRLSGHDHAGREIAASSMVWVIGEGEAFWSGDESVRMSMIASRDQYDIGDTARLALQANLNGATALVALERDGILSTHIEHLGAGVSSIEVPIEAAHAPNVFVSVAAIRGRRGDGDANRPIFRMGVSNLVVSPRNRRLDVAISTEHDDYHPGDTVNGTITVTSGGQPVHAELSLSAADEGVLQLIDFHTPDPLGAFYRPWSLGVENATNWNRIARGRPPIEADGEAGDDQGSDQSQTRSNFVSSAFWAPALVTDANGQATFTFTAPDNLTAFRLMAAAADEADRFGSADHRIRVRKELMLEPILPRFFGAGDTMQIGVSVHNETETAGDVAVRVEGRGVTFSGGSSQTVHVDAHGVQRVVFAARVPAGADDARVRFAATMGTFSDAFERTLPIRSARVVEPQVVMSGASDEALTTDGALAFGPPTVAAESRLEITLDRTGLATLAPTLRYLVTYPYDGLEQTISTLMPLYAAHDLATGLGITAVRDDRRLRTYTRQEIARIVRHQTGDGTFAYWLSTAGDPGMSAYAMLGLSAAAANGGQVRATVLADGLRAIRSWANAPARDPANDGRTMSMIAYVLALRSAADPGLNARLFEARAGLGPDGRAFLLRALVHSPTTITTPTSAAAPDAGVAPPSLPDGAIATLASEIEGLAVRDGDRATMPAPSTWSWNASSIRSTALALSALIEASPSSALIAPLARGLLHTQTQAGTWTSTQEDAFALLAYADYARSRAGGSTHVTLTLGDASLYDGAIEGAAIVHVDRTLSRVAPGTLHLVSDGPVTYSARVALARPATDADAAAHGFSIERQYLDFTTHLPITSATVGQLITVRLAVHADAPYDHVALVDPLPAGFEPVNTALATEHVDPDAEGNMQLDWPQTELRDQEMRAFSDGLYTGPANFEYVVRATIEGTFTAPGAHIEAMYQPDTYARTAQTSMEVHR
jgi:uncharacterized protein YfaS (alpha-2-macroglobulin family)